MKKYLLACALLALLVPAEVKTQTPTCVPIEQEDFNGVSSAANWQVVDTETGNGSVQISGNALTFSSADNPACNGVLGACNGRELRLWRPLSQTLSNSSWRAECKFRITDGNGPAHTLIGFTAGNDDPQGTRSGCSPWSCPAASCSGYSHTPQNGIFASLIAFGNDQTPSAVNDKRFTLADQTYDASNPPSANDPPKLGWRIFGHAKKGAGDFYPNPIRAASDTRPPPLDFSRGISLPAIGTDFYLRLERLSASQGRISVFSDAAMQNHVVGSPQCFEIEPEIVDLTVVQNATHVSGNTFRSLAGTVDDLRVFSPADQCPGASQPCASPTPGCATISGRPRSQCDRGTFTYTMTVTNNTTQAVQYLLFSPPPGAAYTVSPSSVNLGSNPLNPGQSTNVTLTIGGAQPRAHICVNVALADSAVRPCCTVQTCFDLPDCPCLRATVVRPPACGPGGGYTYTVSLTNLTSTPVHQIFIVPITTSAGVAVTPPLINLSVPLQQNQSTVVSFTITGAPPGQLCLRYSPMTENAGMCCSTEDCLILPRCGPNPDAPDQSKPRKNRGR